MWQIMGEVAAGLTGIGVLILIVDRFIGAGKRSASVDGAINSLGEKISALGVNMDKIASAASSAAELSIRLSGRLDEHERRLAKVEELAPSFIRHTATIEAQQQSTRENIERLQRAHEAMQAQITRLVPADTFSELTAQRVAGR